MRKPLLIPTLAALLLSATAHAGREQAEAALSDILFELEMENVAYTLRSDGFVEFTFGAAVSDEAYTETLQRLKAHPDIPGVLAGKGNTNYCPVP